MSAQHNTPAEGASCMCCWDDLAAETYVEYRSTCSSSSSVATDATSTTTPNAWQPSGYCQGCIEQLLKTQWNTYTTALAKTTCKAEQRRLLARGPPINISDAKALPCPENCDVEMLWYMSDGQEHSAKLEGSLVGEARQKYWDEQQSFYIKDETEEEEGKGNDGGGEQAK